MARPPLLLINGYAATVADWDPSFRKRLGESFDLGPAPSSARATFWEKLTDCGGEPRTQATRLISLLFPEPVASEIDSEYGAAVAAARAALEPAGLRAQEGAMRSWHEGAAPHLPERPPPVLTAAGSEDCVIPPGNLELLAERWPRCRVERFAGCGHALMAQEPRRLADLITRFLGE